MIKFPGRQPSRSEVLLLTPLIKKPVGLYDEIIIIHHISEDTNKKLQLEVERRCPVRGISFERIIL